MNNLTIKKSIYLAILLNFLNMDFSLASEESYDQAWKDYVPNYAHGYWTYSAYAAHSFYHSQRVYPSYQTQGYWAYGAHEGTSYQYYHPGYYEDGFNGREGNEVPSTDQYPEEGKNEEVNYDENFFDHFADELEKNHEFGLANTNFHKCPDSSYKDDTCSKNNNSKSKGVRTRSRNWTEQDDELLAGRVKLHLLHNNKVRWASIQGNHFPGRTPKSLRERWVEHLRPGLDKSPLSDREKEYIREFVLTKGNRWTEMAKQPELKGRSANFLKNHWNSEKKKDKKKQKIVPI